MAKLITSAVMFTLYEEGQFLLSDQLEKNAHGFSDISVFVKLDEKGRMVLNELKRKITIPDISRHTAGFGYGDDHTIPEGKAYKQAGFDKLTSLLSGNRRLTSQEF